MTLKNLRLKPRSLLVIVTVVLVTLVSFFVDLRTKEIEALLSTVTETPPGFYQVVDVNDGDTIVVNMNGKREIIRLIGVDTPEKNHPERPVQCFAHAATDFTTNLVSGRSVRLETDPINSNRDRYQRLLRYVYLPDGTLLNRTIIEQGYGFAYTSFPFTKLDEFQRAETVAKEAGMGLWAGCAVEFENGYPNTNPI